MEFAWIDTDYFHLRRILLPKRIVFLSASIISIRAKWSPELSNGMPSKARLAYSFRRIRERMREARVRFRVYDIARVTLESAPRY